METSRAELAGVFGVRRGVRRLVAVVCLASGVLLWAGPVFAFELFGVRLWGSAEEEGAVVDPLDYAVTLDTGDSDSELAADLRAASTLIADEDKPVSGSLGLLAKARGEREQLVAALYEAARYDGTIDIRIAGRSLDEIPPDAEFSQTGPVPVTVRVTPGQVFRLGAIDVRGDAGGIMPARFGLIPGAPAGSRAILKAEADIVRALRDEGRPLASIADRDIVADSRTGTVDVTLVLDAGPVAPFGDTRVQGTQEVDRGFTAYMTGIRPGRPYSPKELEEARERLSNLEVFDSISVRQADALDPDGSIPVDVVVSERKHRYFGVGATVSNTDGAGIEGYWGHRNLFGQAEKLRVQGSISRIGAADDIGKLDYNAALLFEKPGVIGPASKFTSNLRTTFEHPDAFDRFSVKGGVGLSYDLSKTQTVSGEVALDYSKIDDAFGSNRYLIASVPLQYAFDNRDDRLDPKAGFRLLALGEPAHDFLNGATFVKFRGEASAYKAVDEAGRLVVAGRVAGGTIAGADLASIPADRRFYSGGGGSVRGYGYQGIGPVDAAGKPTGGLSFVETSAELRIRVTETFGIVPFIDGGAVSTSRTPDFSDMRFGAGVGVRYLTPFGPLRVDVGVPLDRRPGDPSFGVYAGIGQSF
jgi:translocation and assembly module TamA